MCKNPNPLNRLWGSQCRSRGCAVSFCVQRWQSSRIPTAASARSRLRHTTALLRKMAISSKIFLLIKLPHNPESPTLHPRSPRCRCCILPLPFGPSLVSCPFTRPTFYQSSSATRPPCGELQSRTRPGTRIHVRVCSGSVLSACFRLLRRNHTLGNAGSVVFDKLCQAF